MVRQDANHRFDRTPDLIIYFIRKVHVFFFRLRFLLGFSAADDPPFCLRYSTAARFMLSFIETPLFRDRQDFKNEIHLFAIIVLINTTKFYKGFFSSSSHRELVFTT